MSDTDRYTFISTDTHAHPNDSVYRDYLDPEFRADFDISVDFAPRDDEEVTTERPPLEPDTARITAQEAEGVVGEVVFPDATPPFYPNNVFLAGPPRPEDHLRRRAGVYALNRWMVDFCAEAPDRRAGVGTLLLNDLDDALTQVEWIAAHGLRGGVQLPNITPDVDWITQVADRRYDRLWAACQDLGLVVNMHVEANVPHLGAGPVDLVPINTDGAHFTVRSVALLILGGVFDRFPGLRVMLSEVPIGILRTLIEFFDTPYAIKRSTGLDGTVFIADDGMLERPPSDYLRTNVWYTASPPLVADLDAIRATVGFDHLMVGNDYPHPEGAYPHTAHILRQVFSDWDPAALRKVLGETAAALYGFDLEILDPLAADIGPLVDEIATPPEESPERPNYAVVANDLALGRVTAV